MRELAEVVREEELRLVGSRSYKELEREPADSKCRSRSDRAACCTARFGSTLRRIDKSCSHYCTDVVEPDILHHKWR